MSDKPRLERAGYNALLAEHCELVDRVAEQQVSIDAFERRIGNLEAELRRLGCTVNITEEIVVDFGHGWQIVRELDGASVIDAPEGEKDEPMNVLSIVKVYLTDHGYDGLASLDCGCDKNDLAPCGGEMSGCQPARACAWCQ
jgi:hypothetical protein